jgi:hypothetical protein
MAGNYQRGNMYRRRAFGLFLMVYMATSLSAHEGMMHVMGTVAEFDANHVMVKTRDGKITTILLKKDTKYFKGAGKNEIAASPADMKVGQRIVVDVVGKGQKTAASEIRLGVVESSHNMHKP